MTTGKLSGHFEVRSYEADPRGFMRADCVQNKLQEQAYEGSQGFGAGYPELRRRGLFWVLNRMHFRLLDAPRWGDEVQTQTWSRGMAGPLYHRNFLWMKPDGTPILAGTSAWTVVDLASRSIVRESVLDGGVHLAEDTFREGGAPQFCGKVAAPRDLGLRPAGAHRAAWTDLDTNGHVNNCSYLRWAIDLPGLDYMASHTLCDVQIAYFREIHAGEEVRFLLGSRPEPLPAWEHGLTGISTGIASQGGSSAGAGSIPSAVDDGNSGAVAPTATDTTAGPAAPSTPLPWLNDQPGEAWYLEGRVDEALSFTVRLLFVER